MKDSGEQQQRQRGTEPERGEAFSARERQALAAWQVPGPPADFAAKVMTAWEAEAPPARSRRPNAADNPLRGAAVAAVALLLLGGFFSVRSFMGSAGGGGGGASDPASSGFTAHDGGPGPEVRPQPEGGSERQPS